jgi:hypothetical protein
MACISEMIYMKMDNGEFIYGTNLDIGKYSVKHDCDCEHEFDHVNPSTIYSKFTYVGTEHNPAAVSVPFDYSKSKAKGKFNARGVDENKW